MSPVRRNMLGAGVILMVATMAALHVGYMAPPAGSGWPSHAHAVPISTALPPPAQASVKGPLSTSAAPQWVLQGKQEAESNVSLEPVPGASADVGPRQDWKISANMSVHAQMQHWLESAKSPWKLQWDTVDLHLPANIVVQDATLTEAFLTVARIFEATRVRMNVYADSKTVSIYTGKFDNGLKLVPMPEATDGPGPRVPKPPAPPMSLPLLPNMPKNLAN